MIKPVCFVIFLLSSFFIFSTSTSQAHELSSSGTIEASIHVSPNDEPVALQLSKIEIDVADSAQMFDFSNCICTLQISNSATVIADLPLMGSGDSLETVYTFADQGTYTLTFIGENVENNSSPFTPFELSYTYTVKPTSEVIPPERPKAVEQTSNYKFWIQIGSSILSLLVIATVLVIIRKKRKSSAT